MRLPNHPIFKLSRCVVIFESSYLAFVSSNSFCLLASCWEKCCSNSLIGRTPLRGCFRHKIDIRISPMPEAFFVMCAGSPPIEAAIWSIMNDSKSTRLQSSRWDVWPRYAFVRLINSLHIHFAGSPLIPCSTLERPPQRYPHESVLLSNCCILRSKDS